MPEASRSRSLRRHAPGRQAGDRAILSSRAQRGILRRTTSPARDAGDRDVDRYSEERSDEGTLDASHPDPGSLLAALVRDDIYNAREDAPCRPERPAGGGTLFRGSAYKGPFVAALLRVSDRHRGRLLTSSLRSFGTTCATLGKMLPVVPNDQREEGPQPGVARIQGPSGASRRSGRHGNVPRCAAQLSRPSRSGLAPCQVTSRWVLALVAAT